MSADPSPIAVSATITMPGDIVRRVAVEHCITLQGLRGHCRRRPYIEARRAAIAALLDAYPNSSLTQIGRWIGKHHTTVFDALRAAGRETVGMRANAARPPRQPPPPPKPTPQRVIAGVARQHGIPAHVLTSSDLTRPVARARREAMTAVAEIFPEMRPSDVAALFGRERTTVVRARIALASRSTSPPTQSLETHAC